MLEIIFHTISTEYAFESTFILLFNSVNINYVMLSSYKIYHKMNTLLRLLSLLQHYLWHTSLTIRPMCSNKNRCCCSCIFFSPLTSRYATFLPLAGFLLFFFSFKKIKHQFLWNNENSCCCEENRISSSDPSIKLHILVNCSRKEIETFIT